jgi:hypothetical protein
MYLWHLHVASQRKGAEGGGITYLLGVLTWLAVSLATILVLLVAAAAAAARVVIVSRHSILLQIAVRRRLLGVGYKRRGKKG